MISDLSYLPSLGLSDHVCILFHVDIYAITPSSKPSRYRYHKGDYSAINRALLDVDWEEDMSNMGVTESWNYFSDKFQKEIDGNVPKTTDSGQKKKKKVWMTRRAMRQHRLKCRAWKSYRNSGATSEYMYIRSRNEAKKLRKMLRKLNVTLRKILPKM